MISDTFKILGNHQKVKTIFAVFGIFQNHGREILLDPSKEAVHLVVVGHDGLGLLGILAHEGAHRVGDHSACRRGHLGDVALALGLGVGDILQDLGDVGGLVADSLHVGDHLQCRGDDPQVARHRLLLEQELHAKALNVPLLVVDANLQGANFVGFYRGAPGEGVCHQADGLLAEGAHGDELHVELSKLLIESRPH